MAHQGSDSRSSVSPTSRAAAGVACWHAPCLSEQRPAPLGAPTHALRPLVTASTPFPNDPSLPALGVIRAVGLARAIPSLGLPDDPIELILRSYKPAARATFEARAGDRRFAVKAYASDAIPEAELYGAFHGAGLAGDSGPRVPPLLAFERSLHVMVIGWLEGPTASELVKRGEGRRAGELAASWVRRIGARTDADASEGIRPGPGARHALRPPRHRPGRWARRHRLAAVRPGTGRVRRGHVPRHGLAHRSEGRAP